MSEVQIVDSENKTTVKKSKSTKPVEHLISEINKVINEEKPTKPLKVTNALTHLISEVAKQNAVKAAKKEVENLLNPKPIKIKEKSKKEKSKKEIEKEERALLNNCKGKTKDNKECTRKESENCNGFCKQHFNLEKEKSDTLELIEKLRQ
jgi:hypothetical protein